MSSSIREASVGDLVSRGIGQLEMKPGRHGVAHIHHGVRQLGSL